MNNSWLKKLFSALLIGLLFSCASQKTKEVLLAPANYLLPDEYERTIIQGRKMDQAKLNMIKVGMHQSEVELLLGQPVIQDIFKPNRWIYMYKEKTHKKGLLEYRVEIELEDEKVKQILREGI